MSVKYVAGACSETKISSDLQKILAEGGTETVHPHDGSLKTLETFACEESSDSSGVVPSVVEETPKLNGFWSFFCSFVAPLLMQSLFGGFYIVRTLFWGYALQYCIQLLTITESAAIQYLGKGATPPPALLGLALLTVAALIIHPDGFTWILLRKLRNGLMFMIESSSTCFTIVVNDYGTLVSSILALLTFAGLVSLVYIMQRTLSSKTSQHRARQPASDKQKRKKRKNKIKGRIRTSQQAGSSKDDEDESLDEPLLSTGEHQSSSLPPLVEDKPVLESIPNKSPPNADDVTELCERSDSMDSIFEDTSSCETSVSSASVATPFRVSTISTEKQEYQTVSNPKRRTQPSTHTSMRRHGSVDASSNQSEKLSAPGTPSRWDALKPTSRSERYVPPHRSQRQGRNESRNHRRGRKHIQKTSPSSLTLDSAHRRGRISSTNITSTPPTTHTCEPNRYAEQQNLKRYLEPGLNPESPPWQPTSVTPSTFIAPPPGLGRIYSKEIPFGCGSSSDGGNSEPSSPFCGELIADEDRVKEGVHSLFGAIGPSIPSANKTTEFTSNYLNESFSESALSFRSSLQPHADNPFASSEHDEDKIEAQLQELGGQMVGSILDF